MYYKNLVICPECQEVYEKTELKPSEIAKCKKCGAVLYRKIPYLHEKIFAFSFSALVFFFIFNIYPIISIDIAGYQGRLLPYQAVEILFEKGYVFIALFVLLTLIIFPFLILSSTLFFVIFRHKKFSGNLLRFIMHLKTWAVLDIFFTGVLVSMVKVMEYARIFLNIGFFSMIIFLSFELYLYKYLKNDDYWSLLDV
jgi:paraquat-inducible protein A